MVGAGASCDFGLPLGAKLVTDIAASFEKMEVFGTGLNSRDGMFSNALRLLANNGTFNNGNGIQSKIRRMAEALTLAPSIDAFIETHKADSDIATLGKLAIAAQLLEAEEHSELAQWKEGEPVNFSPKTRSSWLGRLFPILVEGADKDKVPAIFENVSFIVFNYDRCIEHFLAVHLCGYFGMALPTARSIVDACTIIHPYGSLGLLHPEQQVPFGAQLYRQAAVGVARLVGVADNLRTYSEFKADAAELTLAKRLVNQAHQAFFLGFAFHQQNVELLQVEEPGQAAIGMVRVTDYDLSEDNRIAVVNRIAKIFRKPHLLMKDSIGLVRGDCGKIVGDTSLMLSQ